MPNDSVAARKKKQDPRSKANESKRPPVPRYDACGTGGIHLRRGEKGVDSARWKKISSGRTSVKVPFPTTQAHCRDGSFMRGGRRISGGDQATTSVMPLAIVVRRPVVVSMPASLHGRRCPATNARPLRPAAAVMVTVSAAIWSCPRSWYGPAKKATPADWGLPRKTPSSERSDSNERDATIMVKALASIVTVGDPSGILPGRVGPAETAGKPKRMSSELEATNWPEPGRVTEEPSALSSVVAPA